MAVCLEYKTLAIRLAQCAPPLCSPPLVVRSKTCVVACRIQCYSLPLPLPLGLPTQGRVETRLAAGMTGQPGVVLSIRLSHL